MDASSIPPDAVASDNVAIFALPSTVNITTVEDLAEAIAAQSIEAGTMLTLDASAVEILTTPGAQLILTLGKNLAASGHAFSMIAPSPTVTDAFTQLGLSAELAALGA